MMRRHEGEQGVRGYATPALALASAWAIGLAGCTGPVGSEAGGEPIDEPDPVVLDEPYPDSPPPIAAVCPGTQRVGKMQKDLPTCPDNDTPWIGTRLFGANAPAPLASYCLYTWTGPAAPNVAPPPESGRPGYTWTEPDCMAVTPMAPPADLAESQVRSTLKASFWSTVERPSSLPMPGPAGTTVRVAVIDSWPSLAEPGTSRHGVGMAGVIDDLTCDLLPPGGCPVQIVPHLALNIEEPGVLNNTEGGYFGHQSRLAAQIYAAVTSWQASAPASKLVVNLSLGWDPAYQNGPSGGPRVAAMAVHDAIEHAACSGALVLAAAGNNTFGPSPRPELIYPAAWRNETGACPGSPPLLWAVGGLDSEDRPLYNTRDDGLPVLSAPGELAYGGADLSTGPFEAGPFTGSSVSTAVVSAAAAAVWMYDGTRSAASVVNEVRSNALPLSTSATACPSGACPPVKRISICRAARGVAPGAPASVPCTLLAEGGGSYPKWTPLQLAAVESLPMTKFIGPALPTKLLDDGCSLPVFTPLGTATFDGPSACPVDHYSNAVLLPSIGSQPGSDPCGACALTMDFGGDATLDVAVSSDMAEPVSAEVLTLFNAGVEVARYDIGSLETAASTSARDGKMYGGNLYQFRLANTGTAFDSAILEWVNTPDVQTTSRVVVFSR